MTFGLSYLGKDKGLSINQNTIVTFTLWLSQVGKNQRKCSETLGKFVAKYVGPLKMTSMWNEKKPFELYSHFGKNTQLGYKIIIQVSQNI